MPTEAAYIGRVADANRENASALHRLARAQEAIAAKQETANLIAAFHGPFANYLSHEQYDELHVRICKRLGIEAHDER